MVIIKKIKPTKAIMIYYFHHDLITYYMAFVTLVAFAAIVVLVAFAALVVLVAFVLWNLFGTRKVPGVSEAQPHCVRQLGPSAKLALGPSQFH